MEVAYLRAFENREIKGKEIRNLELTERWSNSKKELERVDEEKKELSKEIYARRDTTKFGQKGWEFIPEQEENWDYEWLSFQLKSYLAYQATF